MSIQPIKIILCFIVLPVMELKPNCGSDKAWVWSTPADYSDEETKAELLAIRFGNAESKFALLFYIPNFIVVIVILLSPRLMDIINLG